MARKETTNKAQSRRIVRRIMDNDTTGRMEMIFGGKTFAVGNPLRTISTVEYDFFIDNKKVTMTEFVKTYNDIVTSRLLA